MRNSFKIKYNQTSLKSEAPHHFLHEAISRVGYTFPEEFLLILAPLPPLHVLLSQWNLQ